MVTAIIIVGVIVVGFIFREQIRDFFTLGLGNVPKAFSDFGNTVAEGAGALSTSIQKPFGEARTAIFEAGASLGAVERKRQEMEQILRAERDIELAAKDQGFSSIEEFNRVTDSGSIVVGGTRTTVDFGLIGNVIPSDPSPEFLASPEGQRIFGTRGSLRFGGQRN